MHLDRHGPSHNAGLRSMQAGHTCSNSTALTMRRSEMYAGGSNVSCMCVRKSTSRLTTPAGTCTLRFAASLTLLICSTESCACALALASAACAEPDVALLATVCAECAPVLLLLLALAPVLVSRSASAPADTCTHGDHTTATVAVMKFVENCCVCMTSDQSIACNLNAGSVIQHCAVRANRGIKWRLPSFPKDG